MRSGSVTLADGSEVNRAAIYYQDDDGAAAVRRVQVARRGGFTFVLVLSAPATEMERQRETFDTILASFTSFPPAPYGIPRDRAFTMPLGEPSTLDPAIARETTSHLFVSNMFSGLVRFGDDLSVEADLAEDWVIDDGGGRLYVHAARRDNVPRRPRHHRRRLQVFDRARRRPRAAQRHRSPLPQRHRGDARETRGGRDGGLRRGGGRRAHRPHNH